jgi:hypothetical protein
MRRTGEQIYEATYANHYMGISAEQIDGTLRFDMSKKSMDRDEFFITYWKLLTDARFKEAMFDQMKADNWRVFSEQFTQWPQF